MVVRLYTDGACVGNPGPAGIGYVIEDAGGEELAAVGRFIGRGTNNIAEYSALLRGLEHCRSLGATEVQVISDSELLVRQLTGVYKVKNERLQRFHREVQELARQFGKVTFHHILREGNQRADGLAGQAIREARKRQP